MTSGSLLRLTPLPSVSATLLSLRWAVTEVTAANFDHEVMQSASAVCLVYTIEDSKCASHMQLLEQSADEITSSLTIRAKSRKPTGSESPHAQWLKVCQIDGDKNRNLAAAFSVERSKLPSTFFIFHGTIVDRVSGLLSKDRIDSIFSKFLEYYAENSGVDYSKKEGASGAMCAPAKRNLSDVASTKHKIGHLITALLGPDRIRLPEEVTQVDGLRRDLQQTKKEAFVELYQLHQKHGLDVRKASDAELERLLFGTEQFYAAAVLSGLEALVLARCYALPAGKSNVLRQAVSDAKAAVERDFLKRQLKDDVVRQAVALTDVCLVLGDATRQMTVVSAEITPDACVSAEETAASSEAGTLPPLGNDPASTYAFLLAVKKICEALDHRLATPPPFPAAQADLMLAILKKLHVSARRNVDDGAKFAMIKSLMMALLQLYPRDTASLAMRSRVSAILF